jgi:hypothetical protein
LIVAIISRVDAEGKAARFVRNQGSALVVESQRGTG